MKLILLSIREAPITGELKRDICTKERLVTLRSIIVAAEAIVAVCLSDTVVYYERTVWLMVFLYEVHEKDPRIGDVTFVHYRRHSYRLYKQRLLFYVRAQFAREKNKKTRIKRKPPMIRSMIHINTRQDPNRKALSFLNEGTGSHHID